MWKRISSKIALAAWLNVEISELEQALEESKHNYISHPKTDRKGKVRQLCYPPKDSVLRKVQVSVRHRILNRIAIVPEVCGYRPGLHNINVAESLAGSKYTSKVDISKFHPSIDRLQVAKCLAKRGIPWPVARCIARLVTYKGSVPQGASTSNHVANLIVDEMMRRKILPYAMDRNVRVKNFGDDIAFYGDNEASVSACSRQCARVIESNDFEVNAGKCTSP
ncbi:MAG: hypothetical protein IPK83_24470 [Planctomycetes bacterium]|nr:hypothetical protein [Planctomycetota bacterium]